RLRLVDDQTARVRRPVAVLGLQSRILHPDGRTGAGDEPHPAVRHLRGADHAAADNRTHGGHDRFDFARAVRRRHHSGWQRREYTQMGIWPGAEHYRRRYDYCAEYVTIMRELWERRLAVRIIRAPHHVVPHHVVPHHVVRADYVAQANADRVRLEA